ncbi:hypothetical protein P152DRAFT_493761 [Eremomyces bilateralis CBS 781.70]|uniref:DUF8021 domain-containing protein n=1 Tax=Eremomyces bilateralis CBS 781.70 TaxID=1392243 RepID=A0A6G1FWE2_9PEZI|nr:uncharacterized protein P152DRAFT_493761 [Eremomyces bilateralis CBS 781.70]KAF1810000.1 hypothetical protein P152DRAFT_493761 [Eremomyces bilateralis CBS 781.70]
MRPYLASLPFSVLPSALCACTRPQLESAVTDFFNSAVAQRNTLSTPLSSSAKITQNNQVVSLAQTSYANLTNFAVPWQISAVDVDACQIASMRVPTEAGRQRAILSIRMALDNATGAIDEIEIVNALPGSHMLFAPERFPAEAPAVWSTPYPAPALTRVQLIAIANSYAEGIQSGDGSGVLAAAQCVRNENGVTMTQHCEQGLSLFRYPIPTRRWVVDRDLGVVLGMFAFDKSRRAGRSEWLYLHEYFKAESGRAAWIEAAMHTLYGPYTDAWAG